MRAFHYEYGYWLKPDDNGATRAALGRGTVEAATQGDALAKAARLTCGHLIGHGAYLRVIHPGGEFVTLITVKNEHLPDNSLSTTEGLSDENAQFRRNARNGCYD